MPEVSAQMQICLQDTHFYSHFLKLLLPDFSSLYVPAALHSFLNFSKAHSYSLKPTILKGLALGFTEKLSGPKKEWPLRKDEWIRIK